MTKQFDKDAFEQNQFEFYKQLGKAEAYREMLKDESPSNSRYRQLMSRWAKAHDNMDSLMKANNKILGM